MVVLNNHNDIFKHMELLISLYKAKTPNSLRKFFNNLKDDLVYEYKEPIHLYYIFTFKSKVPEWAEISGMIQNLEDEMNNSIHHPNSNMIASRTIMSNRGNKDEVRFVIKEKNNLYDNPKG